MCSQSRDTTVCISRCLRLLFVLRMRSSRFWPSLAGAPRLARPGAQIAHKSIGVPGITTAERRSGFVSYREDCEKKSEVLTIQVGSAL